MEGRAAYGYDGKFVGKTTTTTASLYQPIHSPHPFGQYVSTITCKIHHQTAMAETMDGAIGELVRRRRRIQKARAKVGSKAASFSSRMKLSIESYQGR